MKNLINIAIAIICFTFFFNAESNAQVHVLSDNSATIGSLLSSNNSKLRVYNVQETLSIKAENRKPSGTQYGISSTIHATSTGDAMGIYNTVKQKTGSTQSTTGVKNYVYARGSGTTIGQYNYVYGYSDATGRKYGSYNYIYDHGTSGTKYGVYSRVLKSSSSNGTMYAGYFLGDVYISGSTLLWIPTPGTNQKQASVTNALDKLTSVNTFAATNLKNGKQKTSYSLDPTSLKQAFPELVVEVDRTEELVPQKLSKEDEEAGIGAKEITENNGIETAVDVNSLIPVLVEAIKEQQLAIEEQQKEIEALKTQIKAQ